MKTKKAWKIFPILLTCLLLISCSATAYDEWDGSYDEYYEPESESGEEYLDIEQGDTIPTGTDNTVTFSLKVDTSSYANVRRYLTGGYIPPSDAVKIEELINYFNYDSVMNFDDDSPFALSAEIGKSPFTDGKYMAVIRVKTPEIDRENLPSSNLVFLIDTSGSMDSKDKLPLLKEAFALLVNNLDADDRVSIVTYAGNAKVALTGAPGSEKETILRAIDDLEAGGSTAGADGILTAYEIAEQYRMQNGNNRVILATDGDFNVGISSQEGLNELISEKRSTGIYLSVLGFGTGNLHDSTMETLAKNGNGNYSYIDSVMEAEKVLVNELGSNLYTVADDVKAQVEFNPEAVSTYRLIGYENRLLDNEDFADDSKDAGEIGAGADIVLLFELEPAEGADGGQGEQSAFELRIRYKDPGEKDSRLMTVAAPSIEGSGRSSTDFGFASSVALFGDVLRGGYATDGDELEDAIDLARENLGRDEDGYRAEYLELLLTTRQLLY